MSSVSNSANSERVETPDVRKLRPVQDDWLGQIQKTGKATRPEDVFSFISHPLSTVELAQLAILRMLDHPFSDDSSNLQKLSRSEWKQVLQWLDYSGVALYFFDRFRHSGSIDLLPHWMHDRLQLSLDENIARTRSQIEESAAIQQEFQRLGIHYSVIKGISLWPHSVPDPVLRSQLDLDFLVAEESADTARNVLERRGYRLYAASDRSLEFKCNEQLGMSVKDLYKDLRSWSVELHVEPTATGNHSRLDRLEWRELFGMRMPTLSSVDIFLGQGLHVHKNVCAEFLRSAHVWEFRNAVLSRRHDAAFWKAVRIAAIDNRSVAIRLGVVLLLITEALGESAPDSLTGWTVPLVPAAARMWIRRYGHRSVLGRFPGSKRYLLLQKALHDAGVTPRRHSVESLIPTRLPPPIIRPLQNESSVTRILRNWMQFKFIAHRLRFHLIAGFDYWHESQLWAKIVRKIDQ